jgi:hypothetical protein
MYAWEAYTDTPLARRIYGALNNKRAFAAYLRSLPDDTVFERYSPERGLVVDYLRARGLGPVRVYSDHADWEEYCRYNECLLPRPMEQFLKAFGRAPDGSVKTAREVWARVTAPAAD